MMTTMLFSAAALAGSAITPLDYDPAQIPIRRWISVTEEGLAWEDRSGRNYLFWQQQDGGGISVEHVIVSQGRAYRAQARHVPELPCEDDGTFDLYGGAHLSDADQDGVGEITFAIRHSCITDVSAHQLDIEMWEAGEVHRLWGETVWWNDLDSGTVKPPVYGASFLGQPALRAEAEARFRALVSAENPSADITFWDLE